MVSTCQQLVIRYHTASTIGNKAELQRILDPEIKASFKRFGNFTMIGDGLELSMENFEERSALLTRITEVAKKKDIITFEKCTYEEVSDTEVKCEHQIEYQTKGLGSCVFKAREVWQSKIIKDKPVLTSLYCKFTVEQFEEDHCYVS